MNTHRPFRPSVTVGILIGIPLAIIIAALLAGMQMPSPPEAPPPPDWLNRLAQSTLDNVLQWLYWLLFTVSSTVYFVLLWQRKPDETPAARWHRRLYIIKGVSFWLALALGRTLLQEWLLVGYASGVIIVAVTCVILLGALIWTYLLPILACRGDRCVNEPGPAIDGGLIPVARGTKRRKG